MSQYTRNACWMLSRPYGLIQYIPSPVLSPLNKMSRHDLLGELLAFLLLSSFRGLHLPLLQTSIWRKPCLYLSVPSNRTVQGLFQRGKDSTPLQLPLQHSPFSPYIMEGSNCKLLSYQAVSSFYIEQP